MLSQEIIYLSEKIGPESCTQRDYYWSMIHIEFGKDLLKHFNMILFTVYKLVVVYEINTHKILIAWPMLSSVGQFWWQDVLPHRCNQSRRRPPLELWLSNREYHIWAIFSSIRQVLDLLYLKRNKQKIQWDFVSYLFVRVLWQTVFKRVKTSQNKSKMIFSNSIWTTPFYARFLEKIVTICIHTHVTTQICELYLDKYKNIWTFNHNASTILMLHCSLRHSCLLEKSKYFTVTIVIHISRFHQSGIRL